MRKMYSDKQLAEKSVNAVKKAIEEGEIDVGGVPTIAAGDAGKVLTVNQAETGSIWADIPDELPAIESGDAGKALVVNSGETGVEWTELPDGLPTIASGDANKILAVNSSATGAEWQKNKSLVKPDTAPTTNYELVGIDTSNNQTRVKVGKIISTGRNSFGIACDGLRLALDNKYDTTTSYNFIPTYNPAQTIAANSYGVVVFKTNNDHWSSNPVWSNAKTKETTIYLIDLVKTAGLEIYGMQFGPADVYSSGGRYNSQMGLIFFVGNNTSADITVPALTVSKSIEMVRFENI